MEVFKLKNDLLNKKIKINSSLNFDLNETFNCGQCFRWNKSDDGYFYGIAFNKLIGIAIKDNEIQIIGASQLDLDEIWRHYFDLDLDYSAIKKQLSNIHPVLNQAAKFAPGIRILRQDPWEALCSFIISQNNNIPRIKKIISSMCENFGEKIQDGCFSFPEANIISKLEEKDLAPLRCGFRSSYILDAAKKVASGEINFNQIGHMALEQAREELMKIKGVGPKVAECTLLYGLHRLDAFPLDVWMKRAMQELFPGVDPQAFGEYAGIAQQYIFHYSRMNPTLFKKD